MVICRGILWHNSSCWGFPVQPIDTVLPPSLDYCQPSKSIHHNVMLGYIVVLISLQGATAILDYHTIQSPLAQPRSSILGHAVSAIVGVGITKLFMLRDDFEHLRWIAGAVSCAAASSIMGITNTVHPPGGATALLAAIDPNIGKLGWYFVALVILGSLLMLLCALLINNIQRQFPVFWWTPRDVGKQTEKDIEVPDAEKETVKELLVRIGPVSERDTVIITPGHIIVPEGLDLGQEERGILEILRDRLRGL